MSNLNEFLAGVARLRTQGYRIGEHPSYGGVTKGAHSANSEHYKSNAADINFGAPGIPVGEKEALLRLIPIALDFGLNVIYTPWREHPNAATARAHRDHLHVDGLGLQAFPKPAVNLARARQRMAALTGDDGILAVGDHGDKVERLQREMNRVFPAYSSLIPDGDFGPRTEAVVKEFQARVGIERDGRVGPDTKAHLARFGVNL